MLGMASRFNFVSFKQKEERRKKISRVAVCFVGVERFCCVKKFENPL